MSSQSPRSSLEAEHTPAAVRRRLDRRPSPSYLRDFIYGAIDGTITTFAVVAGVEGASLDATIVIILGAANLLADGFSMAASNFLGSRAERQQRELARSEERRHIALVPAGEREELRQMWLNTSHSREQLAADLQSWCRRAEESGIVALQQFSMKLRSAHA